MRPGSGRSPRLGSSPETSAIDRDPRGIPQYELKVAALNPRGRQILELAEEHILADRSRTHARRVLNDGSVFDLTAYDEFGVLLSFRESPDGRREFIDFVFYEGEF